MVGQVESPDGSPRLKSTPFLPDSYLFLLLSVVVETLQTKYDSGKSSKLPFGLGKQNNGVPGITKGYESS